jgi:hypothetical protein
MHPNSTLTMIIKQYSNHNVVFQVKMIPSNFLNAKILGKGWQLQRDHNATTLELSQKSISNVSPLLLIYDSHHSHCCNPKCYAIKGQWYMHLLIDQTSPNLTWKFSVIRPSESSKEILCNPKWKLENIWISITYIHLKFQKISIFCLSSI